MKPEVQEAVGVLEQVCASVSTDLNNHQVIQRSLAIVKSELGDPTGPIVTGKPETPNRATRRATPKK